MLIRFLLSIYLLIASCFTFCVAQTFELVRGNSDQSDFLNDVIETPEGNFLAVGRTENSKLFFGLFNTAGDTIWTNSQFSGGYFKRIFPIENGYRLIGTRSSQTFLVDINETGEVQNSQSYPLESSSSFVNADRVNLDTLALLVHYHNSEDFEPEGQILIIDETAALVDSVELNLSDSCSLSYKDLLVTSTNEVIIHYSSYCSFINDSTIFKKLNVEYEEEWEVKTLPTWSSDPNSTLAEDAEGNFYFAYGGYEPFTADAYILPSIGKISAEGTVIWYINYNNSEEPNSPSFGGVDCILKSISLTDEGNLLVSGNNNSSPQSGFGGNAFIGLLDTEGEVIWDKEYYRHDYSTAYDYFSSAKRTNDGRFICAGYVGVGEHAQANDYQHYLVLTDSLGCLDTYLVSGYAMEDTNIDCEDNIEDEPIPSIQIKARRGFENYSAYTDENGYYELQLPIGEFTISPVVSQNTIFCEESVEINADYFISPTSIDFLMNLGTSVEDLSTSSLDIQISPNPAQSWLSIQYNNNSLNKPNFSLINVAGEVVFQKIIDAPSFKVNISNIPTGLYLCKIDDRKGNTHIEKVMINR